MTTPSIESPGCIIFLIDESMAMDSAIQEESIEFGQEPKSKAVSIANLINSLLKQLSSGPDFDIALIGYQTEASGLSVAKSRWSGPLEGREFVPTSELAGHPILVETRQRRIPDPSSFTGFRVEPVEYPVWYQPRLSGIAPQSFAFQACQDILERWNQNSSPNPGQPLIIHLFAGSSGDGNPAPAIDALKSIQVNGRSPLVFQSQLCSAKNVPATLYASNRSFLSAGPIRELFDGCSPLSAEHVAFLKASQIQAGSNARGMLHNAKLIDIVRFLGLVKVHVANWPPRSAAPNPVPADDSPAPLNQESSEIPEVDLTFDFTEDVTVSLDPVAETEALVTFVFDRSAKNLDSSDSNHPVRRLQEQLNELLGKMAKKAEGKVSVAVISYGADSSGGVELRTTFEGELTGNSVISDTDLLRGAVRTEEFEQQLDNGIGGLITLTQQRSIFFEFSPTAPADPCPAFSAAGSLVKEWVQQHPRAKVPPIVLHLTRGQHAMNAIGPAVAQLRSTSAELEETAIYHVIATESPHSSVSYCEDGDQLIGDELQAALEVSSPLLGRERLMATHPSLIRPQSRGFVVNGKFSILLDAIRGELSGE